MPVLILGLLDAHVCPSFQRMQLDRVLLHDSKRQTYDQTRKCTETLLLLGQVGPSLLSPHCWLYRIWIIQLTKFSKSIPIPHVSTSSGKLGRLAMLYIVTFDNLTSHCKGKGK